MNIKTMKRTSYYIIILIVLSLVLSFISPIHAIDVTLGWDPNPENKLGGYKIYYKSERSGPPYNGIDADQGPSPIILPIEEMDNPSTPKYTLTGLDDEKDYFFRLRAYSGEGLDKESGFSNEVSTIEGDVESAGGGCFIVTAWFE